MKNKIIYTAFLLFLLLCSCSGHKILNIEKVTHIVRKGRPIVALVEVEDITIPWDQPQIKAKANGKTIYIRPNKNYIPGTLPKGSMKIQRGKKYLMSLIPPESIVVHFLFVNNREKPQWDAKPFYATNMVGMYIVPFSSDVLKSLDTDVSEYQPYNGKYNDKFDRYYNEIPGLTIRRPLGWIPGDSFGEVRSTDSTRVESSHTE